MNPDVFREHMVVQGLTTQSEITLEPNRGRKEVYSYLREWDGQDARGRLFHLLSKIKIVLRMLSTGLYKNTLGDKYLCPTWHAVDMELTCYNGTVLRQLLFMQLTRNLCFPQKTPDWGLWWRGMLMALLSSLQLSSLLQSIHCVCSQTPFHELSLQIQSLESVSQKLTIYECEEKDISMKTKLNGLETITKQTS